MPYLLVILLVFVCLAPAQPAQAQGDDASELMRLVNELRAANGLEPYRVDPGLMAMAQQHSEYQAAIHTSTHGHSDGNGPPQLGVVENVAGGDVGYLTPQAAIYEIWADPGHQHTMLGYASGAMGVGVADDGTTVFYTLEVRPDGAATPTTAGAAGGTPGVPATPIPLVTLVASTPRPDGSIVHVVGYGQTLWSIALLYGIHVDQIRAWNNLPSDSNEIYAGQYLLVRPANLAPPPATLTAESAAHEPAGTEQPAATQQPAIGMPATGGDPAAPAPIDPAASPPGSTPTEVASVTQPATETIAPMGIQAATARTAETGWLVPSLGAGSLLVGCVLLLVVRRSKK